MVVPEDVPALTNPLDDPIVAIPVLVLVHNPPLSIAVNVVDVDIQIVDVDVVVVAINHTSLLLLRSPQK